MVKPPPSKAVGGKVEKAQAPKAKKERTPAQKAATARMLAANKARHSKK
jgi:hypothetical protein